MPPAVLVNRKKVCYLTLRSAAPVSCGRFPGETPNNVLFT